MARGMLETQLGRARQALQRYRQTFTPASADEIKLSTLSVVVGKTAKDQKPLCDVSCPYCISQMTPLIESAREERVFAPSLERIAFLVEVFARVAAGIPYGIITGKGEPTLIGREPIVEIIQIMRQHGIVPELQTNGKSLTPEDLAVWHNGGQGLNTVAFSAVSHLPEINHRFMAQGKGPVWDLTPKIRAGRETGLLTRITVILTRGGVDSPDALLAFMKWAEETGVHQVTFRKMGTPRNLALPGSEQVAQWIEGNYVDPTFIVRFMRRNGQEKTRWPWAMRFGYKGISVVVTDHMSAPDHNKMRHAVIQPDGHLYGSWDDPADIII